MNWKEKMFNEYGDTIKLNEHASIMTIKFIGMFEEEGGEYQKMKDKDNGVMGYSSFLDELKEKGIIE